MDVGISRNVYVFMPQQFLDGVDICTVPSEGCTIGVAQFVGGQDRRARRVVQLFHKPAEFSAPTVRPERLSGLRIAKDIGSDMRTAAKQVQGCFGKRDGPVAAPFRLIFLDVVAAVRGDRPADGKGRVFQVDVFPFEPQQLSFPQAGFQEQHDLRHLFRFDAVRFYGRDLLVGINLLDRRHLYALRFDVAAGVTGAEAVIDGGIEDPAETDHALVDVGLAEAGFFAEELNDINRPDVRKVCRPEEGEQVAANDVFVGIAVGVRVNKGLFVCCKPLLGPTAEGDGFLSFKEDFPSLVGKGLLDVVGLGLVACIFFRYFRIEGFVDRTAVDPVADDCLDLVVFAVVRRFFLFSGHKITTFL